MSTLNALKQSLAGEYNTKDFGEVKTIIKWQIDRDTTVSTMKIYQSAFIWDLVIEEGLTNCNINIIPMKTSLSIEILEPEDYEEADFCIYQRHVGKLIYLLYDTRPDITFVVG